MTVCCRTSRSSNWACDGMPLAALAFLSTVAYLPGVPAGAIVLRWGLLSIAIPVMVLIRPTHPASNPGLGFVVLAYATLSLLWTRVPVEGVQAWWQLVLFLGAAALGARERDLAPMFAGAAIGMGINGAFALAQLWGWQGIIQIAAPAGLFANKNFMGETAALALVGVIFSRFWYLMPLPALALVLSGCRGAWLAAGVAIIVWLWRWFPLRRGGLILVALTAYLLLLDHVTSYGPGDITARWQIWHDTIDGFTLLGHGIGGYVIDFPLYQTHYPLAMKTEYAHDDYLQLIFELGVGAIPLLVLAGRIVRNAVGTAGLGALAFLVEALVGFPLHMPCTVLLGGVVAGHVLGRWNLVRAGVGAGRGDGGTGFPYRWREAHQSW